jgi:hypothetical protein
MLSLPLEGSLMVKTPLEKETAEGVRRSSSCSTARPTEGFSGFDLWDDQNGNRIDIPFVGTEFPGLGHLGKPNVVIGFLEASPCPLVVQASTPAVGGAPSRQVDRPYNRFAAKRQMTKARVLASKNRKKWRSVASGRHKPRMWQVLRRDEAKKLRRSRDASDRVRTPEIHLAAAVGMLAARNQRAAVGRKRQAKNLPLVLSQRQRLPGP